MSTTSPERKKRRFGVLEKRLGYCFNDYANLERALTHASVRKKSDDTFHYERLEFLGDRVLGLAIAQMLYTAFPDADEGELSLRLNAVVKGITLAEISDDLGLHEFIRTGGDLKELKGKRMQSVRADVLEALIASIFLDGGLEASRHSFNASGKSEFMMTQAQDEIQRPRFRSGLTQTGWAHLNILKKHVQGPIMIQSLRLELL